MAESQQSPEDNLSPKDRYKNAKIIIEKIKTFEKQGKVRESPAIKSLEEKLKHLFNIPPEYSITDYENISLDEVILKYESHLEQLGSVVTAMRNLLGSDLLKNASDVLAMRGILLLGDSELSSETIRDTVLETVGDVTVETPTNEDVRNHDIQFCSKSDCDAFCSVLEKWGCSVAESVAKKENETKEVERNNSELQCLFSYCVVPTGTCELSKRDVRLTYHAINMLKLVSIVIRSSTDQNMIDVNCEHFLKTFGSHVMLGTVHFGGIFGWQVIGSGDAVKDVLKAFKSATNTGFSFGQCKDTDRLTMYGSKSDLFRECVQDVREIKVVGGAKNVEFFPIWKIGLMSNNATWCVIDRVNDTPQRFTGIWELLFHHASEFQNLQKLHDALQATWKKMADKHAAPRKMLSQQDGRSNTETKHLDEELEISVSKEQPDSVESEAVSLSSLEKALKNVNSLPSCQDDKLAEPKSLLGEKETMFLKHIELIDYYPSKITLQDVTIIQQEHSVARNSSSNMAWKILQKTFMSNFKGREIMFKVASLDTQDEPSEEKESFMKMFPDSIKKIVSSITKSKHEDVILNPQDVFVAIYVCCDLFLKQCLVDKMVKCQLAVPFIFPQLTPDSWMCSIWALRCVVMEWKKKNQETVETSLTEYPSMHVVSFVRLGYIHPVSKSKLVNNILSDLGHNTFFHRDCPQGNTERQIANGMVEASWYLPSGKAADTFENITMFLNLRGDGLKYQKQMQLLMQMSNVIVACVDISSVTDMAVMMKMKDLHGKSAKVVLLLVAKNLEFVDSNNLENLLLEYYKHVGEVTLNLMTNFSGKTMKNLSELKDEVSNTIAKCLEGEKGKCLSDALFQAENIGIAVDEMDVCCQQGKDLAKNMFQIIKDVDTYKLRNDMLPLQGENWLKWTACSKMYERPANTSLHDNSALKVKMNTLRKEQLNMGNNLSALVEVFLSTLTQKYKEPIVTSFFVKWLNLYLDNKSRSTLSALRKAYMEQWNQLTEAKNRSKSDITKNPLEETEHSLAVASFGLEHLLRELAQLYEAAKESSVKLQSKTAEHVENLPMVAAELLLQGQPLEILDGDTSTVPLTWIKAVFNCVAKIAGDKKVFILSVLGIQSSGKSTLLNTMFGTQFAVSAGRCTRGVYMHLIKIQPENRGFPFEYLLVIDTEGLRAPEFAQLNHERDNELATFVIGLSDLTMINIKGEYVSDMKDVLQIVVHAFLRMQIANKDFQLQQSCIFLHQNVSAISANEKMMYGNKKLLDSLDDMTNEAAKLENIADIHTFNEVLSFNTKTHVWYFSDLWLGDPPMAPANPGYSEKALEVKHYILQEMTKKQSTFLRFSQLNIHIHDLWKGVLADDFVFSFRNSLALKAYTNLESKCNMLSWDIENKIVNWVTTDALIQLQRCHTRESLQKTYMKLVSSKEEKQSDLLVKAQSNLIEFIDENDLKDILIQWRDAKSTSLIMAVRKISENAETDMKNLMESIKFNLVQKEKQSDCERLLTRKARALADEMRGTGTTDSKLQEKFDNVWQEWLDEIGTHGPTDEDPISVSVGRILWDRLQKDHCYLREELEVQNISDPLDVTTLRDSITRKDILHDHISIAKSWPKFRMPGTGKKHHKNDYCMEAFVKAQHILQKVEKYLSKLRQENCKYEQSYAAGVINIIVEEVQQHNEEIFEECHFKLLPNLMVKLVVLACRYAVKVFIQMEQEYQETHGLQRKLVQWKNTLWNLFKNLVDQCAEEVIIADMICDRLAEHIKESIFTRLPGEIIQHISHLYTSKFYLMLAILDDLALKGKFESYNEYVLDAKQYAFQWIINITNKIFFDKTEGGQSKFATYAQRHVKRIITCVENSIKTATLRIDKDKEPLNEAKEAKWTQSFCDTMSQEIHVSKNEIHHIFEKNIADFNNLQRLIKDRLQELEGNIFSFFKQETAETIHWDGLNPFRTIIERLWGCPEQCPFCKEPCQWSDTNHLGSVSHRCIQHRSQGIAGLKWKHNERLCIENCCYLVQAKGKQFSCSACSLKCQKSGKCPGGEEKQHDYLKYKTYLPDWDIAPNPSMEHSDYWKWVLVTYQENLAKITRAKLPDIPAEWTKINMEQACNSLREYQA